MTLAKTEAGLRMLKDRHSGLLPRQRAALILFDGRRSLDEVLAATAGGGMTLADLERLVQMGLLADVAPEFPGFGDSGLGGLERDRYLQAYGLATALTAELGGKWGNLNLAVEAAGSLAELRELAPRIRSAVGPLKFSRLATVLQPR